MTEAAAHGSNAGHRAVRRRRQRWTRVAGGHDAGPRPRRHQRGRRNAPAPATLAVREFARHPVLETPKPCGCHPAVRGSGLGSAAPVRGLQMQSFGRVLVPSRRCDPRTTAIPGRGFRGL